MRVLSGTHTIDASAYGYLPETITNVSVVSGTTTTLAISLTPAPSYLVSGVITDAVTGWPLAATIDINGYPSDPISTDPASGLYSVTLAASIPYSFSVSAPNYVSQQRSVGPLTGDESQNFALQPDFNQGCPPGTTETTLFSDGFETGTLGSDWSVITTVHGWVQVIARFPYLGYYSTHLHSYESGGLNSIAALILTQDLSGQSQVNLDFWWREFLGENDLEDGVFISDDNGVNWYPAFSFNDSPGSFRHGFIDISAAAAANGLNLNNQFQIKFQFYGNDSIPMDGYVIDEVRLTACNASPTGRVIGSVYDANTGLPLVNATVNSDNGRSATTDVNGFYQLFDTPGSHTLTATMANGYSPDVQIITLAQDNTLQQDFNLQAGWLAQIPTSLDITLGLGESTTLPLNLANNGGASATFELRERDQGFDILHLVTGPFADPKPLVPQEYQQATSAESLNLPPIPSSAILDAGQIIQSWPSGLANAWGIAYDGYNDTVWVGLGWDSIETIYEYQPDGSPLLPYTP